MIVYFTNVHLFKGTGEECSIKCGMDEEEEQEAVDCVEIDLSSIKIEVIETNFIRPRKSALSVRRKDKKKVKTVLVFT